jgi:hypothetical protein
MFLKVNLCENLNFRDVDSLVDVKVLQFNESGNPCGRSLVWNILFFFGRVVWNILSLIRDGLGDCGASFLQ